jgi:hypothetical protein
MPFYPPQLFRKIHNLGILFKENIGAIVLVIVLFSTYLPASGRVEPTAGVIDDIRARAERYWRCVPALAIPTHFL